MWHDGTNQSEIWLKWRIRSTIFSHYYNTRRTCVVSWKRGLAMCCHLTVPAQTVLAHTGENLWKFRLRRYEIRVLLTLFIPGAQEIKAKRERAYNGEQKTIDGNPCSLNNEQGYVLGFHWQIVLVFNALERGLWNHAYCNDKHTSYGNQKLFPFRGFENFQHNDFLIFSE